MRQYMVDYRKKQGLTLKEMAKKCKMSVGLLDALEVLDYITHPAIAARVAHCYELTLEQYNSLVSEDHKADKLPPYKDPPHGSVDLSRIARGFRYD